VKIVRDDAKAVTQTVAKSVGTATPSVEAVKGFGGADAFHLAAVSEAKDLRRASPAQVREGISALALRAGLDSIEDSGLDPRYFDVTRAVEKIDQMVAKYPAIASKVNLSELPGAAKTHEGRDMFALKLGNKKATGSRPCVFIVAQHHARELNAVVMAVSAMDRIAQAYGNDPAITKLLDERDVYIVPIVNPDGVNTVWTEERYWRKNRAKNADGSRGVDINRNYPFLHGLCGSSSQGSSEVFHGSAPGSEPEVRTMMAVQKNLRPELLIDFHNHGNEVLNLYPPCAKVDTQMKAFSDHYVERLKTPMGFDSREASGSGEGPQWHWSQGTLSFLIEVGSAFQPPFEETLEDAKKVWKGLEQALTTWAPAARGKVSSADGQPLEATFTVKQPLFKHGEHASSRASDGRFSLWLPKGTWDVEVAAPGHEPKVVQVKVEAYDQPVAIELKLDRAKAMVA
jgi:hypothetical protein